MSKNLGKSLTETLKEQATNFFKMAECFAGYFEWM